MGNRDYWWIDKEWWSRNEIPDDPKIHRRINSAQRANLTPLKLDSENKRAEFQGTSEVYDADLTQCSCRDFLLQRSPCKHMFRLAMELGLLDLDFDTGKPSGSKDLEVQREIRYVASMEKELLNRLVQGEDVFSKEWLEEFSGLLKKGLAEIVTGSDTFVLLLNQYSVKEIIKRVSQALNVKLTAKKTKADLIDLVINDFPEHIEGIFNDKFVIRPTGRAQELKQAREKVAQLENLLIL